jgi:hypothetical protein
MFVVQATPQAVESARTIIVLFAAIFVIFWRVMIRIVVMVAAIVAIVLLTSGAILIYQIIFHIAR